MKRLGKCPGCGVKPKKVVITVECPSCGTLKKATIDSSILGEL